MGELREEGRAHFSFDLFCDQLDLLAPHAYAPHHFPKLLTVHACLGEGKTVQKEYLYHLGQLMRDRRFVGVVSGRGNEALFVVGLFQELAVILDPHYVQEEETYASFFSKNPQGVEFTQLASPLAISFFIPSLEEMQDFASELLYAERVSAPYCCFRVSVAEEASWTGGRRKGSDDFQLL